MRRAITFAAAAPSFGSHEVQAGIDSGRGARARDDPAVFDEQYIGIHRCEGVVVREALGVHPVRGCTSAVENACSCEHERPAADAQDPRAAGLCLAQHPYDLRMNGVVDHMRGNRDQVGVVCRGQPLGDEHGVPLAGGHRARFGRHDVKVEGRTTHIGTVDSEDFADNAELEGGHMGEREEHDLFQHGGSL